LAPHHGLVGLYRDAGVPRDQGADLGQPRGVDTGAKPQRSLARPQIMTTSSSEALPARSPMPLMVHSTRRAPLRTAAMLLAVDNPRSLWQCTLIMARSIFRTLARIAAIKAPNSLAACSRWYREC